MGKGWIVRAAALGVLTASSAPAQPPVVVLPLETQARRFVELLFKGEVEALGPLMDDAMRAAMSPDRTRALLELLAAQAGDWRGIEATRQAEAGGYQMVFVTCAFEKSTLDARVVFDGEGLVTGLFFQPTGPQPEPVDPPYADRSRFVEEPIEVVSGEYRLPGTLTLPVEVERPPVGVLVHGSGPNDRDETIGPNKVFRDLAWGLAMRGVATLRYEKRTRVYGGRLPAETLTHREEVVEDALAAVSLAAADARLDVERLVLVGHSLGGTLGPLIALEAPALDGVVLMAGANRPLLVLMDEQIEHLYLQDGKIDEAEKRALEAFRQAALELVDGGPARGLLTGLTRVYLEALNAYRPLETILQLKVPILVTQGGRDYQVPADKDFENWKGALAGRRDATFRLYPELDHLFMPGEGPSYPTDYMKPRNVDERFIEDLAAWMLALGRGEAAAGSDGGDG